MDQTAPAKTDWIAFLKGKLRPLPIILSLAIGAALSSIYWVVVIKPMRETVARRYQTHNALMRLYDLQVAYKAAHGSYANDPETLIDSAPDAAQLRATLKANADYGTLTVVGDAERFKLEANVQDAERTALKLRGPLPTSTPTRAAPEALPEPIQSP